MKIEGYDKDLWILHPIQLCVEDRQLLESIVFIQAMDASTALKKDPYDLEAKSSFIQLWRMYNNIRKSYLPLEIEE